MKKLTLIISLAFLALPLFSQNSNFRKKETLTKTLIGVWQIEKVIDKNGNEVNEITKEMKGSPLGDEIKIEATGPKITLLPDGKYELEFNPRNIDKGNWFLESPEILIFQLITKKGTSSYELLKSAAEMFGKEINYDSNGNIVENNKQKIVLSDEGKLLINYEINYFQIYKKKK
jgi:hypothetical protein